MPLQALTFPTKWTYKTCVCLLCHDRETQAPDEINWLDVRNSLEEFLGYENRSVHLIPSDIDKAVEDFEAYLVYKGHLNHEHSGKSQSALKGQVHRSKIHQDKRGKRKPHCPHEVGSITVE